MPNRDEEYVTVVHAAASAGVSAGYLRRLLGEGRIAGKKPGRDWLVYMSDVTDFLKDRRPRGRPFKVPEQHSDK